jgi:hypothetical protein
MGFSVEKTPLKHQAPSELPGIATQKTVLSVVLTVRTSNPTEYTFLEKRNAQYGKALTNSLCSRLKVPDDLPPFSHAFFLKCRISRSVLILPEMDLQ